jgi:ArsR family transcriptional regulator
MDIDRMAAMAVKSLPIRPLEPLQLDAQCCAPLGTDALDQGSAQQLAQAFKALGDPVRLRLLSIIASAPTGEVCACDLTEPVGKSQPTVSHHLKILREAGLVTSRKHGTWVHYRAVPDQMQALQGVLTLAAAPPS